MIPYASPPWSGAERSGNKLPAVEGLHDKKIALVTAREARALDEDLPPLVEALRELGAGVDVPCWDDPQVDWAGYDAAVIRSTWDYIDRIDEFLGWTERAGASTRLCNPPAVVRWNSRLPRARCAISANRST